MLRAHPVPDLLAMPSAPHLLEAHDRSAQAVAFTRDGKHLVTGGLDGRVRLFGVPGFRPEREWVAHPRGVTALALVAEGRRLLTAGAEASVRVWDLAEGTSCYTLEKQALGAASSNGEHLATVSASGQLALWNGDDGSPIGPLPAVDKRHLALAFAPNGAFLFVGGTGPIHRLALPEGQPDGVSRGHEIGVGHLAISPNQAVLASTGADGTLRFWTVVGGEDVSVVPLPGPGSLALAFAPDGRSIAVALEGAVVRLAVPDGGLVERHEVEAAGVHGVAISPDGAWLANAGGDGRVRVWSLR
jgi:WD40 repeat protein